MLLTMNVLVIESSGRCITAALRSAEGFFEMVIDAGFRHAETLMPGVNRLMEMAALAPDAVDLTACSAGPGSFTALRIGMATAKGIARGAGCAFKAVPALPLLAAGREHWPGIVMPVMDARKKRVYTAAFRRGERIRDDADISLEAFLAGLPPGEAVLATGPDAGMCEGTAGVTVDPLCASGRGRAMVSMALEAYEREGGDPGDLGPLYLRPSEAELEAR